jgi:hypothetical protein
LVVAKRAEGAENQIRELTDEEARDLFDRNARYYLGISGEEFLRRWDAGFYDDPDDRSKHGPEVMEVAMLIRLVRQPRPSVEAARKDVAPPKAAEGAAEGGREMSEAADRRDYPDGDEDLKRKVLENLDALDRSGKLAVLNLSQELSSRAEPPAAEPERNTRAALLEYAGVIPKEDLDRMSEAIEEGCERVDEEGW